MEKKEIPEGYELNKAAEEYAYTNWESDDYHEGASEGMPFDPIGHTEKCFIAGAEWQRARMEDEHGKELLYVCQKTAEREHRSGIREGKAQAEKDLIPLINRLCEAILFEWKDAADLARKTLLQIKAREE